MNSPKNPVKINDEILGDVNKRILRIPERMLWRNPSTNEYKILKMNPGRNP